MAPTETQPLKGDAISSPPYSLLVLAVAVIFVNEFTTVELAVLFPSYAASLGVSETILHKLAYLQTGLQILSSLIAPSVIYRVSHMPTLIFFEGLLAICHLALGLLVPSFTGMNLLLLCFCLRTLIGVCLGFASVAALSFIIRELPEAAAAGFISGAEAVQSVAYLIAPIAGSFIFEATDSFTVTFVLAGLLIGTVLTPTPVLLVCHARKCAPPSDVPSPGRVLLFFATPTVLLMLLTNGLAVLPLALLEGALSPHMKGSHFQVSVTSLSIVMVIGSATSVLTAVTGGILCQSLGMIKQAVVGLLIASAAFGMSALLMADNSWVPVLAIILAGVGTTLTYTTTVAMLMRLSRTLDFRHGELAEAIAVAASVTFAFFLEMGQEHTISDYVASYLTPVQAHEFYAVFYLAICFVFLVAFTPCMLCCKPLAPILTEEAV